MRRFWHETGRPAEDLHLWLTMSAVVLRGDEDVDSTRVREIGGPMAMAAITNATFARFSAFLASASPALSAFSFISTTPAHYQ